MFTPIESGIGGLIIGAAVALALLVDGKIAGCSGILGPYLRSCIMRKPNHWKALFLAGLVIGGLANFSLNKQFAFPEVLALSANSILNISLYAIGGLLTGIGTRLGTGCTSGHGLCGLARLSPRSLTAVSTFMGVAAVTVYAKRQILGEPTSGPSIAALQWPPSSFPVGALIVTVVLVVATLGLSDDYRKGISPLVSGTMFGLGLGVAGMTAQSKVFGFLDVLGCWDPSLAFVMGCGLCVTFPAYAYARKPDVSPLADGSEFEAPGPGPGQASIDTKLVLGSAVFGVGWGIGGVCPGPALAGTLPYTIVGWLADPWTSILFPVSMIAICVGWLACDYALGGFKTKKKEEAERDVEVMATCEVSKVGDTVASDFVYPGSCDSDSSTAEDSNAKAESGKGKSNGPRSD
eukprot:gnl/TRDRNA2_/TRDRNA2_178224_c0_seq1.p1 gnl/TRDRNA2_/TRDRNA2_178224_c0~~gnl/TRDRNA2_/TRDRNA2_178224_c0_seq1.p1  ORF type:complete len:424 (+),score=35.48 gnl/TRDRNA2_/TRDRNA2_178224_c0_seq1:55-1272(+)